MPDNVSSEKNKPSPGKLRRILRKLFKKKTQKAAAPRVALPKLEKRTVGGAPGLESRDLSFLPSGLERARVTCIDYSPEQAQVREIHDLPEFLSHHRPAWAAVRWIHIEGVTQMEVIRAFAEKYQLHPLAIEDLVHRGQRPKAEDYPGHDDWPGRLVVIARMLQHRDGKLHNEQINIFLGRKTVITFQETQGDIFQPIRQRIQTAGSRLRTNDASFLLYSLLDALIDHLFPILEHYSTRLEEVEDELLESPSQATLQKIHAIKRELVLLRRGAWPMRDVIAQLIREKHECLSETTRTYFRDVYDHCVQIIDFIETYREICGALTETYMSTVSNRMNEVMKVLTIIGTIFIPLTFLAGVYGMNMPIPENELDYSYPIFWVICLLVGGGMLIWFRKRGWI